MKSLKKIFSLLITVSLIIALGMQSVSASSYPSSIKVSSIGKINYGGTYSFPVKYTSDGTLAYCTEYQDQFPMGVTMSLEKRKKVYELAKKYNVDEIVVAIPSAGRKTISAIVAECQKTSCKIHKEKKN